MDSLHGSTEFPHGTLLRTSYPLAFLEA